MVKGYVATSAVMQHQSIRTNIYNLNANGKTSLFQVYIPQKRGVRDFKYQCQASPQYVCTELTVRAKTLGFGKEVLRAGIFPKAKHRPH